MSHRVRQCSTLWDMSPSRRNHVTVRLSEAGLAKVRELAEAETEGNASQMIRKLLAEALQNRDRKARP